MPMRYQAALHPGHTLTRLLVAVIEEFEQVFQLAACLLNE